MKSISGGIAALALALTGGVITAGAAQAEVGTSPRVLINEVYGGGGNSGGVVNRDFIELVNPTDTAVDLTGWAVQYGSAGTTTFAAKTALSGTIAAGATLLVGEAPGADTSQPAITPDIDGTIAISGTGGKVALTNSSDHGGVRVAACAGEPSVVDLVGWGELARLRRSGGAGHDELDVGLPQPDAHQHGEQRRRLHHRSRRRRSRRATPDPGTPTVRTIAEIQGTGAASPLVGETVVTEGVVTAAYPTGRAQRLRDPDGGVRRRERRDRGCVRRGLRLLVRDGRLGGVGRPRAGHRCGQRVQRAHRAHGRGRRRRGAPDRRARSSRCPSSWPTTDTAREALESMLFQPTGPLTITNTFSTNQFGEVGLAAGTLPLLQPTEVGRPGSAEALAAAADNAARGVVLDDGSSTNFLSAANSGLTPPYVSLTNPVRVGASATLTAPVVVDFRNNVWKLQPDRPRAGVRDVRERPDDRTGGCRR